MNFAASKLTWHNGTERLVNGYQSETVMCERSERETGSPSVPNDSLYPQYNVPI